MTTSTMEPTPTFNPALARKLLHEHNACAGGRKGKRKVSNEAAIATGELLRLFVHEALNRASIEAECEQEGSSNAQGDGDTTILIRPDHITKISADMLMDFT